MVDNWLKICSIAFKSKQEIIDFKENVFKFKTFRFKETNKGYMIIWNINTLNAFTVSRLEINNNILTDVIEINPNDGDISNQNYVPKNLIFENSKPY